MAHERHSIADSEEANQLRRIANALEAWVERVCKRCNGSGQVHAGSKKHTFSPACNGKGY